MADGSDRTGLGEIISELLGVFVRHINVSLLVMATVAAFTTLFLKALGPGGQILASISSFFIVYHYMDHVLRAEGLADPSLASRNYASMFGVMLLSTVGIIGAMCLLIVPGLYVAARWSLAQPLVIGEGLDTTDALRQSWHRTASTVWPIAGAYLLMTVASILIAIMARRAAGFSLLDPEASRNLAGIAASGLGSGFGTVLAVCFSVALYRLVGRSPAQFHAVFD